MVNMSAIGHTGWALGVGRRLLDELKVVAAAKSGTRNAAVDTAQFHADRFLRDPGAGTQHITSTPTVLQNWGK
ncbi:hypothetical protein [Streptomyces sp. NPDC053427]|uniref:hypothetical protein n=1 Tax=Streptomyces sp. NPDC053427 TaxID=3365701 RepID=UPI0037CFAB24